MVATERKYGICDTQFFSPPAKKLSRAKSSQRVFCVIVIFCVIGCVSCQKNPVDDSQEDSSNYTEEKRCF